MDMFMNKTDRLRKVAIYIRVSTQEQKVEGYGLEAQKKRLLDFVENSKNSLNLHTKKEWIFSDTHTGSDLNRPALQDLRKKLKEKKFDAVLVWKIDRLSRSLKHLLSLFEEFEKNEVSFISVQENLDFRGPIGRLIFQMFGAIAQFERELIKGRTTMGKIASAEMGNYTGTNIPYGYKPVPNPGGKGKKLAIIPEEQKWIEQIFEWYIYEGLGFRQIMQRLNEWEVPRGQHSGAKKLVNTWTEKMVDVLISNEIYRGIHIANRKNEIGHLLPESEWTIVKVPPCISELTFQQAQRVRSNRVGGRSSGNYLLSGKMVDMTVSPPKKFSGAKRSKGGFSYRRKQFKTKDGGQVPVFEIPGKQIEDFVWSKILEAMQNPEVFIKQYLSKEYLEPKKASKLELALANLRAEKAKIQEIEIGRVQSAYEKGMYNEDTLQEKLTEKEQKISEIEEKIQQIEDELALMSSVDMEVEKLRSASEQVRYRLENLNQKQKRILCELFVDKIEMYRKRDGKRWDVQAEIYFRFNPTKFGEAKSEDRTRKADNKGDKKISALKNKISGGAYRT